MVKNLRGGKSAKKQCSKVKSKTKTFPSDAELFENPDKYVIGKIIEQHNQKHYMVLTMDTKHIRVFVSTDNNIGRLTKDSYVLIFSPNVEYHFKKKKSNNSNINALADNNKYEKHKSIIICKLDDIGLHTLQAKFGMVFVPPTHEGSMPGGGQDIDFREKNSDSDDLDLDTDSDIDIRDI